MNIFYFLKKAVKKKDGKRVIILPHPCCFFCGDFSLGEAGAVSGAQGATDSADILEKMC